MNKTVMIIVIAIVLIGGGVGAFFLLKKKDDNEPSAEELAAMELAQQQAAQQAAIDSNLASAQREAEEAALRAQAAKNNTLSSTEMSAEEKQEQLDLMRAEAAKDEAEKAEKLRRAEIDKYNSLGVEDKFKSLSQLDQDTITKHQSFAYDDMKGSNAHNIGSWRALESDFNANELLFAFFILTWGNVDSQNDFITRVTRQNWGYTKNPACKGSEMKAIKDRLVQKARKVSSANLLKSY